MKGFSSMLLIAAGFLISPALVALVNHFIPEGPDWFPFVIVLLFSGILYAVGILRGASIGMILGVVLFGVALATIPLRLGFLPADLRTVPAPF